jgi:hypothetical protein
MQLGVIPDFTSSYAQQLELVSTGIQILPFHFLDPGTNRLYAHCARVCNAREDRRHKCD